MQKKGFIFLAAIFWVTTTFSQYFVTKVVGHVKKTNGEELVTGSTIGEHDVLQFSSPNDMVRVVVAGKGVYVINSTTKPGQNQDQVVDILRYTMRVKPKEGYLSGRGSSMETIPDVLDLSMGGNKKILIEDSNRYLFDARRYNITDGGRFILQITRDNEKPAIRVLTTIGDTLFILARDFGAGPRNANSGTRYTLGYFSRQKNSTEAISDISPFFDTHGEMITIIKGIVISGKKSELPDLQNEAYGEVWADLGKPSDIDFQRIFYAAVADLR